MPILERQVQFAFLENLNTLEAVVGFPPKIVAAYLDISAWGFSGQIDFVLSDPLEKKYITELELIVNSQSKIEHVVEQVVRYYKAAQVIYSPDYEILILLASESPIKWQQQIVDRLKEAAIAFRIMSYDLLLIEKLYLETLERNKAIFGLHHEDIRQSAVASLAQLNQIFAEFKQVDTDHLTKEDLFQRVSWRTRGAYTTRLKYAQYLRLIKIDDSKTIWLTPSGCKFRDYTNIPYRESQGRYFDLSEMQKRILRQNIVIELRTSTQINRLIMQIVTFLQHVSLIRGKFIPRGGSSSSKQLPEGVVAIYRELIQKRESLTPKTIADMIYWSSLYCQNLGLIRIIDDGEFNRTLFTEEGVQFYRLVSDLINIRREESKIVLF